MWKVYRGHSLKGCRNHSPLAEPPSPGSKKLVKSHLPEELWELHLWRCQTGKSNNLWPPEPFSLPRSISITLWHPEIIKNGQNLLQFNSPTCNRSLSSTCFSFLSPERGMGVANRKNLNLKHFQCIKQNFFLVTASTHQSLPVTPTQQHSHSRFLLLHSILMGPFQFQIFHDPPSQSHLTATFRKFMALPDFLW